MNRYLNELKKLYAYTLINYDRDWASFRDLKKNTPSYLKNSLIFENQGDYRAIENMMVNIAEKMGVELDFATRVDLVTKSEYNRAVRVLTPEEQKAPWSLYQIEMRLEAMFAKVDCRELSEEKDAERE